MMELVSLKDMEKRLRHIQKSLETDRQTLAKLRLNSQNCTLEQNRKLEQKIMRLTWTVEQEQEQFTLLERQIREVKGFTRRFDQNDK
jgi:hypothetical protein